jgi:hypothetical protein
MGVRNLRAEQAPFALGTADMGLGLFATADELIRFHRSGLNGNRRRHGMDRKRQG